MTYIELAIWFTAVAAVLALALTVIARRRGAGLRSHLVSVAVTVIALIILTAIFDSLMIAADLFFYAPEMLVGLHIGLAPIEDFSYPIAGAVLLPSLWLMLRWGKSSRAQQAEVKG